MSTKTDLALSQEEKSTGSEPDAAGALSSREMQELWFTLAKREWGSLAIIPADPEASTEELARSLATVGKNLSYLPVSAVTVKVIGPSSALALAALAHHVRNRQERLWHGNGVIEVVADPAPEEPESDDDGYMMTPVGQLILGVPSVIAEPVALAVAQAVDFVVLGVELGRTNMKDLQRSIDLIGRDRIAGCCLL